MQCIATTLTEVMTMVTTLQLNIVQKQSINNHPVIGYIAHQKRLKKYLQLCTK